MASVNDRIAKVLGWEIRKGQNEFSSIVCKEPLKKGEHESWPMAVGRNHDGSAYWRPLWESVPDFEHSIDECFKWLIPFSSNEGCFLTLYEHTTGFEAGFNETTGSVDADAFTAPAAISAAFLAKFEKKKARNARANTSGKSS